jgi:hypothetical protein
MRALAVLIAVGVSAPAWAQIEEHSSGVSLSTRECNWCLGAEIGLNVAAIALGVTIGYAVNALVRDPYGTPLWIGGAVSMVAAAFPIAWFTGLHDNHPEWLGSFIGSLVGVVGAAVAYGCWLVGVNEAFSRTNSSQAGLALVGGAVVLLFVPPLSVMGGIEIARGHRFAVSAAPLSGGGGAAVFRGEF